MQREGEQHAAGGSRPAGLDEGTDAASAAARVGETTQKMRATPAAIWITKNTAPAAKRERPAASAAGTANTSTAWSTRIRRAARSSSRRMPG